MLTLSDAIIPIGLANSKCRPSFIFTPLQAIMQTDAAEQQEQIAALRDFAATGLAKLERLLSEGDRGQAAALQNFAAGLDLAKLERLIAQENQAQIAALENFAADAPGLEKLKELNNKWISELDLFDVLGVVHGELVHSRFLTWLLDPQQNHGSRDHFLKSFLYHTCTAANKLGISAITPAKIHSTDWSGIEVRREWQNIDILILNRNARFVCAVENKILSGEGIGADGASQLTRYRETLENEFPDFTRHFVFLSPQGIPSQRENERPFWVPETYATILQLVEQTIHDNAAVMTEDVRVFLRQYATTLRRNIVPDSNEVQQIAREIYLKHREAIDLIIKYKPDFEVETKEFFRQAIEQEQDWVWDSDAPKIVRFRSADWDRFPAFRTGTGWSPSSSVMAFEIDFKPGHPRLVLILGPSSDEGIRQKIHKGISEHSEMFSRARNNFTPTWTTLDNQGDILDSSYLDDWDAELMRDSVEAWMLDFAERKFPAMNEVIVKCLEEYEAEQA